MFKKRGNFKKSKSLSTDKSITNNNTNNNNDDEIDTDKDQLPNKRIKLNPSSKILFKKKLNNSNKLNHANNDLDDDNDDDFKEWYLQDEENTNSYLNQFDDDIDHIDHKNNVIENNNDDDDNNINIAVHRLTPPFLDSSLILSSNSNSFNIIKDKSGDLYKNSKNGSILLNEKKKLNELMKNSKDLENSNKINNILDNKENIDKEEDKNEDEINDNIELDNENPENFNKENLPAFKVKDKLIQIINENQVVIIIGETGSGKTTQLPQFLYNEGYCKNGLIGITQPRRMAAISVAKRVSEEMNVKIGNEVGFKIRFNDSTSNLTKIKFMTDGILLREILNDSNLLNYSCIIMDEAHERSLNTDILFGIFKKLLIKRRDFKLIITSATMNSLKFSKFFNNALQFKIPGKIYPVEIFYQSVPTFDYIDSAVKQALKIHLTNLNEKGDILIFMTGQEDIEITCQLINDELNNLIKLNNKILKLNILPVYSNLSKNLQSKIFINSNLRKCIVSTNIAETSLTLKNVKYVIDSGLMKLKIFNSNLKMDLLQIVPISKAQANQRSGRAGRTCPGKCYRLYTLTSFENEMWDEPIPEIQRCNLMNSILLLKNLNINNLNKFQFIDKPSIESIETSQYELWSIGALDNFGNLTKLGKNITKLPIDPVLSKLIIISKFKKFSCTIEIIKIVSVLSVPSIFIRSNNNLNLQKKSDKIRENFQINESDHLTLLNIFNQFLNIKTNKREEWCSKNFFNFKSLNNAIEINNQLIKLFEINFNNNNNNKIPSCLNNWEIIKECLCAAFFSNSAEFFKNGIYKNLRSGLEMKLHPTSSLNGINNLPKYIIYHELLMTNKNQFMNYVTSVKGEWLVKYGNIFFSKSIPGLNSKENQRIKQQEFEKLIEFERQQIKK